MLPIKVENKVFVDALGRTRIFRGVNYVDKGELPSKNRKKGSKADPKQQRKYHLETSKEYWGNMAKLGVTLVRLGVTWDAIEPAPGVYNQEYLAEIEEVFEVCATLGIYVYLDMHQDLYSGFGTGYGDGAPNWAVLNGGVPHRIPYTGIWAEPYFFGNSTARAFDSFWDNKEVSGRGLQDRYADMWTMLATRLKDKENLFGFDFINEPYPGKMGQKVFRGIVARVIKMALFSSKFAMFRFLKNIFKHPKQALDCITPEVFEEVVSQGEEVLSQFDKTRYTPFINKMATAIRKVTDRGIVMQSTSYWGNVGVHYHGQPIEVAGDREEGQCFAPHAYDVLVDTPEYNYASTPRMAFILKRHKEAQDRLGVPVVLGEWGCNCPEGTEWLKHVEEVDAIIEEYQWSETYYADVEFLETPAIKSNIQRAYPRAVAGSITQYKTDKQNNTFCLKYVCTDADLTTEIYLPAEPKTVTGDVKWQFEKILDSDSGILYIEQSLGAHEVVVTW